MKHLFLTLSIVAAMLSACTQQPLPEANYDVIPQPKEVKLTEEKPFVLQPSKGSYCSTRKCRLRRTR